MLDPQLAALMQRVIAGNKSSVTAGKGAVSLHQDFALGRMRGQTLYLTEGDRAEMASMLTANGYSLVPVDTANLSRAQTLAAGVPLEKSGGAAVKANRVSIKALSNRPLRIDGRDVFLPDGCHLDVSWPRIAGRLSHHVLVVVENFEVFDQIHHLEIDLPDEWHSPVVVYRGDRFESRQDNVNAFLAAMDLPVLSFPDIDPQGLVIAAALPCLVGVLAPTREDLERLLCSPVARRGDLFVDQVVNAGPTLDALHATHPVSGLWSIIRAHRAGLVQERWLADGVRCVVWLRP